MAGSWYQLDYVLKYREEEMNYWRSATPLACPRCGEAPLRNAPPSPSGASVDLYCVFDGWKYPGDYIAPEVM